MGWRISGEVIRCIVLRADGENTVIGLAYRTYLVHTVSIATADDARECRRRLSSMVVTSSRRLRLR